MPEEEGRACLELLFHILDDSLTVETDECAEHQLRVYRVRPHHLSRDAHQGSDLCGSQLPHFVSCRYIHETHVILFIWLAFTTVFGKITNRLAQIRIYPAIIWCLVLRKYVYCGWYLLNLKMYGKSHVMYQYLTPFFFSKIMKITNKTFLGLY